ncbi:molybdopterin synthase small subunit [Catenovulum agarivorans DS-2]|uniref:Molybdopterin synthase sulfur carrier subunit n=1 Tax=Catenovulum agarivorans DS-2 TaxID=1328313 RepID=W7QM65_9ALTE|nr:molybdopterin synthase sulfur carrier subunit [Catenovulum agarivorans]EWH10052.1 molybdopterin synthase small subunit [Catenovulum agarivorans DS-2]
MIKVLFFAQLRETLGTEQCEVELDSCTINELKQQLIQSQPEWQQALTQANLLVAVNQAMANGQTVVKAGDEVALFPPVTGG